MLVSVAFHLPFGSHTFLFLKSKGDWERKKGQAWVFMNFWELLHGMATTNVRFMGAFPPWLLPKRVSQHLGIYQPSMEKVSWAQLLLGKGESSLLLICFVKKKENVRVNRQLKIQCSQFLQIFTKGSHLSCSMLASPSSPARFNCLQH